MRKNEYAITNSVIILANLDSGLDRCCTVFGCCRLPCHDYHESYNSGDTSSSGLQCWLNVYHAFTPMCAARLGGYVRHHPLLTYTNPNCNSTSANYNCNPTPVVTSPRASAVLYQSSMMRVVDVNRTNNT